MIFFFIGGFFLICIIELISNHFKNEKKEIEKCYIQMDKILRKFEKRSGILNVEYIINDYRFQNNMVCVSIQMVDEYIINDKYNTLIICSASGITHKEAIDNLLLKIDNLKIDLIQKNLSKYVKNPKCPTSNKIIDLGFPEKY